MIAVPRKYAGDWLAGLLIGLVYLSQLGTYGLLEPDEGRYAEIAREMSAADGEWLIPTLNDVPHFQKPPLIYWLTAASMKCFGVSENSARLPSALAALVTMMLSVGIARRLFPGQRTGRLALLILASSPLFLYLGRTLTPDMLMAAWITGALYCLVRSRGGDSQLWGWLFFVCIGLGFLTKGPVAFLVPIAAAIGWSATLRDEAPRLRWGIGLLLSLLIGLSWFIVVSMRYPELAEYFWKYELLDRIASGNHGRSRPWWFFVPVLLASFLPWSLVGIRQLAEAWQHRRNSHAGLFIGWIVIPFLVLSVSGSKLPTYILPLYPGLAILLAAGLASWRKEQGQFSLGSIAAMTVVLILLAALPLAVRVFVLKPPGDVSLGAAVPLLVGIAFAGVIFLRHRAGGGDVIHWLGIGLIAVWSCFPSQVSCWNNLLGQQACVRILAERIERECDAGPRRVVACEIRAHGLAFYLDESVEMTRREADIVLPDGVLDSGLPEIHRGPKDVARLTSAADGNIPIFVVTRTSRFQQDFEERGWILIQTAGDFALLER